MTIKRASQLCNTRPENMFPAAVLDYFMENSLVPGAIFFIRMEGGRAKGIVNLDDPSNLHISGERSAKVTASFSNSIKRTFYFPSRRH